MEKKKPHPTDVEVGSRIRTRRRILNMSQTTLADKLGLTFQQVQKYEKGTNSVVAGRLRRLPTRWKRLSLFSLIRSNHRRNSFEDRGWNATSLTFCRRLRVSPLIRRFANFRPPMFAVDSKLP